MLDFIFDALGNLFEFLADIVVNVINGIISMAEHVVGYFKGLKLRKGHDVPFIADETKLSELIHGAPVVDCGIFEGTYNEDTNKIENYRVLEGDELDPKIKETLDKETLVVLS